MWSVYSFTGAAILASIVFSLLLFLSIDDDPLMKFLFGGLAVIFELGKFFAWYEVGERKARRNYTGTLSAFTFYAVLAAISIGGSIGGINSATNKAHSEVNVQKSKINAYNMQIEAIEKQIDLNNVAAEKYIQMERIASGVSRIQKQNEELRKQQQQLAMERDSIPVVSQGSVLGLIDSLAETLHVSPQSAQLGLVVFLSVLLDFFAAFFVGLIGEENRFRHKFRHNQMLEMAGYNEMEQPKLLEHFDPSSVGTSEITDVEVNDVDEIIIEPEVPKTPYELAIDALSHNKVNCSKRAVSKFLNISTDEVDSIFKQLLDEGIVSKKPNNHYQWHGVEATAS
ncbi:Preprotein translocase subunit SecY [Photobacterium lucens]|uniref:Preprotein translocase subunit SecY n=1 Tax=Photobacterium lucens TaxID=2562949 RepID=UPI0013709676|nr:Preprotein translocase subunit SecY [Photobacterium lucens]MBP2701262.1 Preprotein translocase subunit SecY [Vibrio parahaemolyticus]MZG56946.1 Preprotein translocase subunit SecY [Photobacterium lucens]MZG82423.1 Preprotein translocase subunit SecY [Photobacterium lucens]